MFKIIVFLTIFLIMIITSQAVIGEYQIKDPSKSDNLNNATNIPKDAEKNIKGVLSSINDYWQKKVVPFLKNIDRNIISWWQRSGKPFFLDLRVKIILFLEKEIFI